MQDNIQIRRALLRDAADIANLLSQLGYPTTSKEASVRIDYMNSDGNAMFVAVCNDYACGLIGVHIFPALHCTGQLAKITALIVSEEWRNRGIGKALLEKAKKFSLANGALRIEVVSGNHRPDAHGFYKANGYSSTNQTKFIADIVQNNFFNGAR